MGNEVLTVRNLCKRFDSLKAVDNVSFSISKGEILGLLGPNGAGKTTTINLITGMLKADSGEVEYNGKTLSEDRSALKKIGICTQHLQLWPMLTCEEQMRFIGNAYEMDKRTANKRTDELLEMIGLKDKRKTISKKLSGGMQRRLHLAMAMIHDPDLIVLDEPEAGLDPQSRILVREFIMSLSKTKTVLLTTHNMDEAERLSTRVAIMDKGKILQNDTPTSLRMKIAPEETLEVFTSNQVKEIKGNIDKKYGINIKDRNINITGTNLTQNIQEILSVITDNGGRLVTFSLRQSTLEDVFIKLTGRGLRE